MKRIATAAALAVAAAFSLSAAAQTAAQPKSVKVQSTWPASLTIQDHLRILVGARRQAHLGPGEDRGARRRARSCRRSRCSTPPARRCSTASTRSPTTGSARTRPRRCSPGRPEGRSAWITWITSAGSTSAAASTCGASSTRTTSSSPVTVWPAHPSSPQAFGWFKKPLKSVADFKGMKCRQTGLNAEIYAKLGHERGEHGRRRDRAGRAARRDRLRRVGRRRRGPAPRPAGRVQVPLHPGHAREQLDRRVRPAPRRVEGLHAAAAGGGELRRSRTRSSPGTRAGSGRTPTPSRR